MHPAQEFQLGARSPNAGFACIGLLPTGIPKTQQGGVSSSRYLHDRTGVLLVRFKEGGWNGLFRLGRSLQPSHFCHLYQELLAMHRANAR